ncbi:MAG: CstA-like transporter-associated (seleno)protein [Gemmatimonas sp.]
MRAPRAESVRHQPGLIVRLARALRVIIGVPDYARYLAHQRAKHPDATPLSREEFARERERARYEGTGTRCC